MAEVRVGLIGCGGISRAHVRGYTEHSAVGRVVAVADTDRERAEERARSLGCESVYADYRALLDRRDVDAVDICLPHFLHAPVALAAIAAGKHVLVEKPMATTLADARQMADAARGAGRILMVGHNQRYMPVHRQIKEWIDAGTLGRVFCIRADCNQYLKRRDWLTNNREAGGGVVISVAVHKLDLMRWLCGDVRRVAAFGCRGLGEIEGEDVAVISLEFAGGALGEFVALYAAKANPWQAMPPVGASPEYLILYGSNGVVHTQGGLFISDEAAGRDGFRRVDVAGENSFVNEIGHYLECVATGRQPVSSGQRSLGTMAVLDAIYRAMNRREAVDVEPTPAGV